MEQDLSGRVAVVTGGSRGLGRAISLELARCGAFVVVNYCRNEAEAGRTLEQIRSLGAQGRIVRADVGRPEEVRSMFEEIYGEHRRVDILINNAGITRDEYFMLMRDRSWQEVLDTDLNGVYYCCRAVVRTMSAGRRGVILTIGSGSGMVAMPGQVNYSAAKAALLGFSRSLAREVADKGVRVLVVSPGLFKTEMTERLQPRFIQEALRRTPLGRMGDPEELARLVAFLVSDDAASMTGQVVSVDGGRGAVEADYGFPAEESAP